MTEEQIALGRRGVACKGWRWMPGMLTHDGFRTVWSADGLHQSFKLDGYEAIGSTEQLIPDLLDPATLGCLLALVREAWGEPTMSAHFYDAEEWWEVLGYRRAPGKPADTEAEALVAALEAAP